MMRSIFVYQRPEYIPHPIPWERLEELKRSKKPRSSNEFHWLYFPKESERLFYAYGDPHEIGKYIAEKAMRDIEPQLKKVIKRALEGVAK